jgi:cytochrome c-type biogenesis protein|tara:strand:+ start:2920 stop:3624 length:705 start_codon:yes stop_codon:yes gene_type:complete
MAELFIAFGAGLISFLSPCVLPLIPGYISYISGITYNELLEKKVKVYPLIFFTFGFSIVFILFGAAATFIGQLFLSYSNELRIIAGIVILIFSFHILGFLNMKIFNYEKRFQVSNNNSFFGPILLGMAFGFGWTPCIGPILGSILVLAATEENFNKGIMLLFFYSLGLALPFILSGYLIQKFLIFSKKFKKNINLVSKIGGLILLVTGILILTNQLQALGYYILEIFPFLHSFG